VNKRGGLETNKRYHGQFNTILCSMVGKQFSVTTQDLCIMNYEKKM